MAVILELREAIAQQAACIQELEDQVAKHSGNSGKPPSSDGRKKGGQRGHKRDTLEMVAESDYQAEVKRCPGCGETGKGFSL